MQDPFLCIHAEIISAIEDKRPIVALESTLISHGMAYPENLSTATLIEEIIRKAGATPATIAVHEGKIHIGIDWSIMEILATRPDIPKASRADLAFVLSRKITASTTVAATMFAAHLAQLPIFITGGIGGVHQQSFDSFDISADLMELASTPITVVCSGAKSILDLPKTLDMLEAYGVPVVGYQTDEFPAFYMHSSGLPLPHRLDSAEQIAELILYHQRLKMNNGILVANPIPKAIEIPETTLLPIIEQAKEEAKSQNKGKQLSPFLLRRINELTAGQTLNANIELIKSNAQLGAEIALAYQKNL